MKKFFLDDFRIPYRPWVYFFIFTASSAFLAYGSASFPKFWIFLGGIFIPAFLAVRARAPLPRTEKPSYLANSFPLPPSWIWLLLIIAALVPLFWDVAGSSRWAEGDNVFSGIIAVDLLQHWHFKIFRTLAEIPITLSLVSLLLFKISDSPFLNLYFPPAFLGTCSWVVGYAASRQFFSKSFSFLMAGLLAFNYWSIYAARLPLSATLFSLWELAVFYCWGKFLNTSRSNSGKKWAGLLGFCLGMGFLTSILWLVVAFFIFLLMFKKFLKTPSTRRFSHLYFYFLFSLALVPLIFAAMTEGYGRHLFAVSARWNPDAGLQQLQSAATYFSALFWGGTPGYCLPPSGGFWNVFLASFFFLGVIELFRFRKEALVQAVFFAFVLFLLPGSLAVGLEGFRIFAVLPPLLVVTALGVQALISSFPPFRRTLGVVLILVFSWGTDVERLFHPWNKTFDHSSPKSESQSCYEILRSLADQEGPGFILSDLIPCPTDFSIPYFTYPFNAAFNPKLSRGQVKWLALLIESHYVPFLSKRFPETQWVEFPAGTSGLKSRHVLGLFHISPLTFKDLDSWKEIHSLFRENDLRSTELTNGVSRKEILKDLFDFHPLIPDDPFLQSCYFEKLNYDYSWEKTFHPEDSGTNWEKFSGLFQQSFGKSYQDFVLCEKYGRLLATEGKYPEAKALFEKALREQPENQFLKYEIQQVISWEKDKTLNPKL